MPAYELRLFAGGNELNHHILVSSQLPSLLLLDRHMPGWDGHQTLHLIKQHPNWQLVPVVMFSADASSEEMERCYRVGANSFLRKPLAFETLKQLLVSTVHYWLELNQVNYAAPV